MNRIKKEEKKRGKQFPSCKLSKKEFNKLLNNSEKPNRKFLMVIAAKKI